MRRPTCRSVSSFAQLVPNYELFSYGRYDQGQNRNRFRSLHRRCPAIAAVAWRFRLLVDRVTRLETDPLSIKFHPLSSICFLHFVQNNKSNLFRASKVEICWCQNVSQGTETMEQHGRKLDHQNQREEEHKYQTNRFQLKVLLADVHL